MRLLQVLKAFVIIIDKIYSCCFCFFKQSAESAYDPLRFRLFLTVVIQHINIIKDKITAIH